MGCQLCRWWLNLYWPHACFLQDHWRTAVCSCGWFGRPKNGVCQWRGPWCCRNITGFYTVEHHSDLNFWPMSILHCYYQSYFVMIWMAVKIFLGEIKWKYLLISKWHAGSQVSLDGAFLAAWAFRNWDDLNGRPIIFPEDKSCYHCTWYSRKE